MLGGGWGAHVDLKTLLVLFVDFLCLVSRVLVCLRECRALYLLPMLCLLCTAWQVGAHPGGACSWTRTWQSLLFAPC